MNLTEMELKTEWTYRYLERLGNLCGSERPTPEMEAIARKEADEAIRQLRFPSEPLLPSF